MLVPKDNLTEQRNISGRRHTVFDDTLSSDNDLSYSWVIVDVSIENAGYNQSAT
jgi:hypothetical protein